MLKFLTLDESQGLDNRAIAPVVDAHLVRAENRRGATWYELAHDRLIEPVRSNNTDWFEQHLSPMQRQAGLWETQNRSKGLLFRDDALTDAETWAVDHENDLLPVERDFLDACREARAQEQKEQRKNRLIRLLAIGATFLSIMALMLAGFAFIQRNEARKQKERAEENEQIANKQRTIAEEQRKIAEIVQEGQINALSRCSASLQENSQELAGLVEAIRAGRQLQKQLDVVQPETRDRVIKTLQEALVDIDEVTHITGHSGAKGIPGVAFSPDGKILATAGVDGIVRLWTAEGQPLQTLEGHEGEIYDITFSPDGQIIATASNDQTVRLWNLEGKALHILEGYGNEVYGVSFSPDGATVATASVDATVKRWSLQGELLQTLKPGTPTYGLSFSPDSQILGTVGADGFVRLWDQDGTEIRKIKGHEGLAGSITFHPNGDMIATGGRIRLFGFGI